MDRTDILLTDLVESNKTPAVQYAFFDTEKIIKSFQHGYADIEHQQKVDSATTFHAFSVTKTFTALAILQLVEKGEIDLNTAVILYWPQFPYGNEIAIKHLLNHSSGIPNPIPLSWIHLESEHNTFDRDDFFDQILAKHNKVKFSPNQKFAYSNLGFVVLGKIIEKVSGENYETYITNNIINKLPFHSNELSFEIPNKTNHAIGYHKKWSFSNFILGFLINKSKFMGKAEGKWRSFKSCYVNGAAYGGLIGTPNAFVTYLQELMKTNSSLISESFKTLFFQENKTQNGKPKGMCLSWFSGELMGNKYLAHAGGGGGYYCEIRMYPDLKKGSVIFFNRTGMTDERFLDKVDKFFLARKTIK